MTLCSSQWAASVPTHTHPYSSQLPLQAPHPHPCACLTPHWLQVTSPLLTQLALTWSPLPPTVPRHRSWPGTPGAFLPREGRARTARPLYPSDFLLFLSHCIDGWEASSHTVPYCALLGAQGGTCLLRVTQTVGRGVGGVSGAVSREGICSRPESGRDLVSTPQGPGRGGAPCAVRVCARDTRGAPCPAREHRLCLEEG